MTGIRTMKQIRMKKRTLGVAARVCVYADARAFTRSIIHICMHVYAQSIGHGNRLRVVAEFTRLKLSSPKTIVHNIVMWATAATGAETMVRDNVNTHLHIAYACENGLANESH